MRIKGLIVFVLINILPAFGSHHFLSLTHYNSLKVIKINGENELFLFPDSDIYNDPRQKHVYHGEENKYRSQFRKLMGIVHISDFLKEYVEDQIEPILRSRYPKFKRMDLIIFDIKDYVSIERSVDLDLYLQLYKRYSKVPKEMISLIDELLDNAKCAYEDMVSIFVKSKYLVKYNKLYGHYYQVRFTIPKHYSLKGHISNTYLDPFMRIINSFYKKSPITRIDKTTLESLKVDRPAVCGYFFGPIQLCDHHRIWAARSLNLPISVDFFYGHITFN